MFDIIKRMDIIQIKQLKRILKFLRRNSPFSHNKWSRTSFSWSELNVECSGYESDEIIKMVEEATCKVVQGKYLYERDSVVFPKIEYSRPLAFFLMKLIAHERRLSVLDFGGSLGSSFRQNRDLIGQDYPVRWSVIEQKNFYEIGKEKFQTDELKFYPDVESCISKEAINFVLISSVLEYLENPKDVLQTLLKINSKCVVIDRLPVSNTNEVFLTKQIVPEGIYKAQYPCWIFSRIFIQEAVQKLGYKVVFEGKSFVPNPINFGKGISSEAMVFVLEKA